MNPSIEELNKLVSDGMWEAAEKIADEIAFICRMNHQKENPPLVFNSAPRRYIAHPQRIHALMCRLSSGRVIWADEANQIQRRLANKWSGNSSLTFSAVRLKEGRWFSEHTWVVEYYLRGKLKRAAFVWDDLFYEAMFEKCKFVMLETRRARMQRALRRLEEKSLQAKRFINQTKKELISHVKDTKDGRGFEGVSGQHHVGR